MCTFLKGLFFHIFTSVPKALSIHLMPFNILNREQSTCSWLK